MAFKVRSGDFGDARGAADLVNSYIADGRYTALTDTQSTDDLGQWIQVLSKSGVFTVAEDEAGSIVGIQVVFPFGSIPAFHHVGDVGTFVDPAAHRGGVGRALSEHTFERAKDVGFLKLIAMIRADNHRAIEFYRSLGFDYIGLAKKQACVRGTFIDEVFMEKLLD